MRRLLFVVALTGCVHSSSSGPQWPKERAGREGGESLAPREAATSVAVAADKDDDDDKPAEKPAAAAPEKPAPATEGGASAAPATAPTEDVITTEEIVIEVGDD